MLYPEEAVSELVGCVDPFELEVDEVGSEPVESIVDVDLDISGRLVQLGEGGSQIVL